MNTTALDVSSGGAARLFEEQLIAAGLSRPPLDQVDHALCGVGAYSLANKGGSIPERFKNIWGKA